MTPESKQRWSAYLLGTLKGIYCLQNIFFAVWFYLYIMNHLILFTFYPLWRFGMGTFFITIVFILLFQYLNFEYLPKTKKGMLGLLCIPYLNTLLFSFFQPVPWNQWFLDSAFTYVTSVSLAFTGLIIYGCVKGILKKEKEYVTSSLIQLFFIIPALSGVTAFLFISAHNEPTWSIVSPFLPIVLVISKYSIGIISSLIAHWRVWFNQSILK